MEGNNIERSTLLFVRFKDGKATVGGFGKIPKAK